MAKNIAIAYSMKRKKLQQAKAQAAEGDVTKGYYRDQLANKGYGHKEKGVGRIASNKQEHQWKLDEIKEDKTDRKNLAEGGAVGCPKCGYSEGGEVANDTDMTADTLPNEFDELVLSGGLEADSVVKRAMKKKYK